MFFRKILINIEKKKEENEKLYYLERDISNSR